MSIKHLDNDGVKRIFEKIKSIIPTKTSDLDNDSGFVGSSDAMNAKNVKFADGKSAEEKLGAINGITSDLNCEDDSIAASAAALKHVNDSLKRIVRVGLHPSNDLFNKDNAGYVISLVRVGNTVFLSGRFAVAAGKTISSNQGVLKIIDIPEGYRPAFTMSGTLFGVTGTASHICWISNLSVNGELNIRYSAQEVSAGTETYIVPFSYITNDEFPT